MPRGDSLWKSYTIRRLGTSMTLVCARCSRKAGTAVDITSILTGTTLDALLEQATKHEEEHILGRFGEDKEEH